MSLSRRTGLPSLVERGSGRRKPAHRQQEFTRSSRRRNLGGKRRPDKRAEGDTAGDDLAARGRLPGQGTVVLCEGIVAGTVAQGSRSFQQVTKQQRQLQYGQRKIHFEGCFRPSGHKKSVDVVESKTDSGRKEWENHE